jgi:hypothetical protein
MRQKARRRIIKNVETIYQKISKEENEMSEQVTNTQNSENRRRSGGIIGGAILIAIGLLALLEQFVHVNWGLYFLPLLALVFLTAGIIERRPGMLIPGGILAGIGAGAILVQSSLFHGVGDPVRGGLFMITFAAGWAVITGASYLIGKLMLWPLIPAAIIGLFGVALLANIVPVFSYFWPVALIALGLFLILRRRS